MDAVKNIKVKDQANKDIFFIVNYFLLIQSFSSLVYGNIIDHIEFKFVQTVFNGLQKH